MSLLQTQFLVKRSPHDDMPVHTRKSCLSLVGGILCRVTLWVPGALLQQQAQSASFLCQGRWPACSLPCCRAAVNVLWPRARPSLWRAQLGTRTSGCKGAYHHSVNVMKLIQKLRSARQRLPMLADSTLGVRVDASSFVSLRWCVLRIVAAQR